MFVHAAQVELRLGKSLIGCLSILHRGFLQAFLNRASAVFVQAAQVSQVFSERPQFSMAQMNSTNVANYVGRKKLSFF